MRRIWSRILLIFGVGVIAALTMAAAAVPALASHGYEWTDWEQWRDTDWWCSSLWFHDDEDMWTWEDWICWHPELGFWP